MKTNSQSLAFCETFDGAHPYIGRTGQLDNSVWGVSRVYTGGLNSGQGQIWNYAESQLDACGTIKNVVPPQDIQICNGQLRESTNDNPGGPFDQPTVGFEGGSVMALTMYPKQPFDFAGRVGTVAFDISNDTAGSHAAWPEFWMSDMPVPNPFIHQNSWMSVPQNGLAIRFAASAGPQNPGTCFNPIDKNRWTVDSAAIIRDWMTEDTQVGCDDSSPQYCKKNGNLKVEILDCVAMPMEDIMAGPNGRKSHVEIKISQNQIDVYATDPDSTTLKHLAVITNANLTFSRGFVWMEDVHYNADKGDGYRISIDPRHKSQRNHTFAWDNIAFDGPILARDISLDVNDKLTAVPTDPSLPKQVQLGWLVDPTQSAIILNTQSVTQSAKDKATNAFLLFNFAGEWGNPKTFTYTINGHVNTAPWPFPDQQQTGRTIALPIPLNQVVAGANVISIKADVAMFLVNVNLNLAGAAGIVNP